MTAFRLGTRGSRMALFQTNAVAELLRAKHPDLEVEIVQIQTAGDRDQSTPRAPTSEAGTGWFTTAIQEALQRSEVDAAVHSYKDLPTKRPEGLVIAAVPLRDDPRDAFVSRGNLPLRKLPPGAVIGTGSPRREAQLRVLRPDLEVRPIRGNADTRVGKVMSGDYAAAVLGVAGLRRIGMEAYVTEIFGPEEMLPSPAQAAIAVECRGADSRARELLASIDDAAVRATVAAERSFLARLEAGCSFPAAALAENFGSTLKLAVLIAHEGKLIRAKTAGSPETAVGLGRAVAEEIMAAAGLPL